MLSFHKTTWSLTRGFRLHQKWSFPFKPFQHLTVATENTPQRCSRRCSPPKGFVRSGDSQNLGVQDLHTCHMHSHLHRTPDFWGLQFLAELSNHKVLTQKIKVAKSRFKKKKHTKWLSSHKRSIENSWKLNKICARKPENEKNLRCWPCKLLWLFLKQTHRLAVLCFNALRLGWLESVGFWKAWQQQNPGTRCPR